MGCNSSLFLHCILSSTVLNFTFQEKEMEEQDEAILKSVVFQVFAATSCTETALLWIIGSLVLRSWPGWASIITFELLVLYVRPISWSWLDILLYVNLLFPCLLRLSPSSLAHTVLTLDRILANSCDVLMMLSWKSILRTRKDHLFLPRHQRVEILRRYAFCNHYPILSFSFWRYRFCLKVQGQCELLGLCNPSNYGYAHS